MNSTTDVMLSMFGAVHDSPPLHRRIYIFFTPLSGSEKPVHHVVTVSEVDEYSTFCNTEEEIVICIIAILFSHILLPKVVNRKCIR